MTKLITIFKQTLRASLRSRVFHVLMVLTLLAVVALPLTVVSDGTASGELKLSLTYSLTTVIILLSLATVWLGCVGLSREIESYQLHMVMTKPAPGWLVWTAKWLAVFSMNGVIFIISALLIYGIVMGRFYYGDFSEEQKDQARREILVGRRSYLPEKPDFTAIALNTYEQLQEQGRLIAGHDRAQIIAELRRQARARSTEVPPGQSRPWRFSRIRVGRDKGQATLRYRLYIASTKDEQQRVTNGIWHFTNPERSEGEQTVILPQRVMSGSFQEIIIPSEFIAGANEFLVSYVNRDPGREPIIFQPDDGPSLLFAATGFTGNWLRACLVVLIKLAVLAALGCFMGVAFSPPVAVFVAMSCLFLGSVANPEIGAPVRDAAGQITSWPLGAMFSHGVAVTLDAALVSLDAGELAFKLARGRLVELSYIGRVAIMELVIKGGLMAALGSWILARRELGKVIRQ